MDPGPHQSDSRQLPTFFSGPSLDGRTFIVYLSPYNALCLHPIIDFIYDGSSEHGANVNQVFRFVKGTWLHRKSRQIRILFRKRPILLHTCATCSELPSYKITMHPTLAKEDLIFLVTFFFIDFHFFFDEHIQKNFTKNIPTAKHPSKRRPDCKLY